MKHTFPIVDVKTTFIPELGGLMVSTQVFVVSDVIIIHQTPVPTDKGVFSLRTIQTMSR